MTTAQCRRGEHHGNQLHRTASPRRRAAEDVDARRAGRRRGQAPARQRRAPADRLQAHRGDARRALRHRRHRRLGDPDPQGDHPGRGGRGHRLRHDGLQDHADAPTTCPTTWGRCARRSSARCRTAARRAAATRAPGSKVPGSVDTAWAQLEPEFTELCRDYPKLAKTNNIQHLGTLGYGQPLHRGLPRRGRTRSGSCCTRARAAWATSSARCSSSWRSRMRCATTSTCPTATWRTSRKAARYFGDYVRAVGWAQKFARAQPRGDDAPRDRGREDGDPQELPEPRRGGELPPQLRAEGAPLRRRRATSPARAR